MYALTPGAKDAAKSGVRGTSPVSLANALVPGREETAKEALLRARRAAAQGRVYEALGITKDVLKAFPERTELLALLADMLAAVNETEEAVKLFERLTVLNPEAGDARLQLSALYRTLHQPTQALTHSLKAVSLEGGGSPAAFIEAGRAYLALGDTDEAKRYFLHGISIDPMDPAAHVGLGEALLMEGEFQPGWREYAWRETAEETQRGLPKLPSPPWNGMRMRKGTILAIADEGVGEAIQYARYLPLVKARVGRLILGFDAEVLGLFGDHACVDAAASDPLAPPSHDAQVHLSALPAIFQTDVDTVPTPLPYLQAWPERAVLWSARLAQLFRPGALRVGLAWSSGASGAADEGRSMGLQTLLPLLGAEGVDFITLQPLTSAVDRAVASRHPYFHDVSLDIAALGHVAAVIENLDLIISVDAPAAHLAGAMGRETFLLLPKPASWRWLLNRSDSVWYPTFRLFRQEAPGDWSTPIADVCEALGKAKTARKALPAVEGAEGRRF